VRTLRRLRRDEDDVSSSEPDDHPRPGRQSAIARGNEALHRSVERSAPTEPGERMRAGRSFFDEALSDSPWRVGDLYRVGTRSAIGLIGLLVAWAGASTTTTFTTQVIWIGVGVGVVVVSAAGSVGWLVSGFGAVAAERRAIRTDIRARWTRPESILDPLAPAEIVIADGMRRYHLSTCDVVAGKAVTPVPLVEAQSLGFAHCGMCQS
jgi:hypothetical protein